MIVEAFEAMLAEARDRELYDSATLLGSDPERVDVEWAFPAQREAIEAAE